MVGNHIKTLRIGVAASLTYPVVLGCDWKYFGEVLQLSGRDPATEDD